MTNSADIEMAAEEAERLEEAPRINNPRRFLAVIIEFPNDEALARYQRDHGNHASCCTGTIAAAMDMHADVGDYVHPRIYHVQWHPSAPYIYDMTVKGLHL